MAGIPLINTSPLMPRGPSPTAQTYGGIQDLLGAFMERRRRDEEAAALAKQKADELEFRRQQEARVQQRQQSQDQWEREKFAQQQRGEGGKAAYEAYQKGGPEGAAIVAQGYGGSVSPMKPNSAVDFTREDESDPLGFSVTPEYQAEEQRVQGRHTLQMPGGSPLDLGPGKPAQAEHFARIRATLAQLPPNDPNRILAERRLAEAESASLGGKDTLGYIDDGRRMAQQAELARLRAQRKGKPAAGQQQKDLNQQLLTESKYDGIVQKVLQNKGYKDLNTQEVKFTDMVATIAGASDNAALAAIGGGQFVKMAQGGTGVISDSDMRVFWQRIGGLGVRGEQAINDAMSGKLGKDKRDAVMGAITQLEQKARANMTGVGQSIAARLAGAPGGAEQIPVYLQTYAPDYLPVWQAEQAKGGKTSKGVPAALAPADDDRLKRMGF